MSGLSPGLFSALGERERDKEVLEAKKAQWRRELGTGTTALFESLFSPFLQAFTDLM